MNSATLTTENLLMKRDEEEDNLIYQMHVRNPSEQKENNNADCRTFTELTSSPPPNEDNRLAGDSDFFSVDDSNLPPYMRPK